MNQPLSRFKLPNRVALTSNRVALMLCVAGLLVICTSDTLDADWPQWRGPDRLGSIASEPLIESLPPAGLAAVWTLDAFDGGSSGGWSSPVISDGKVYAYAHTKTRDEGTDLGEAKYPYLAPEKRDAMSDEAFAEYERLRREENQRRAKAFRFEERLVCLDLESGDVIWDRSQACAYTRFMQSSTPCVQAGRVYVLGPERTARCYDAQRGDVIWEQRLPGEFRDEFFASSFVVDGDIALVACGPLSALRASDGELLWQGDARLDYQSHSSPVLWDCGDTRVVLVNTAGGKTDAYRVDDGTKLWELASGVGQSTPIVANDLLLTYGSSRKSGLSAYRLDPQMPEKTPELVWQFQRAADSGSTPVVLGDAVFVQGEKRLAKVDLASGRTVWQTTLQISNPRYTSPIAAGNQVFYGWEGLLAFSADSPRFELFYDAKVDSQARLIGADDLRQEMRLDQLSTPDNGLAAAEKAWRNEAINSGPLACSSPALADGRMVLRLRKGLACYDLRSKE